MVHIGVIGVGAMGQNHVRVLSGLKNTSVSISDIKKEKCEEVTQTFNTKSFYLDYKEMLKKEKFDGVIVAAPSAFHKKIVLDCVDKGINVLVEKPIAHSIDDAQEMIDKAKKKGVIFTVGHVERFNPIVTKIKEFIMQGMLGELYLINTTRISPFPKRLYGTRDGVLIDLSVHDIDIIRYLAGEINEVYSQLIFSGGQEIYSKILFTANNNIRGSAEFSWVSPKKVRTLNIFGVKGMLEGDYQNQELRFYENSEESETAILKSVLEGKVSEGKMISYPIYKQEPLKLELENFIDCIKNNKKPLVSPEDAKEALKIALSVLKSGKKNVVIKVSDP